MFLFPYQQLYLTMMYKVFEFISELVGWLHIVLSPLCIGLAIGAFIYFPEPSTLRLVIGIAVAVLGLVVGIIWATRVWKKHGTVYFLSRVDATPELDAPEDKAKDAVR